MNMRPNSRVWKPVLLKRLLPRWVSEIFILSDWCLIFCRHRLLICYAIHKYNLQNKIHIRLKKPVVKLLMKGPSFQTLEQNQMQFVMQLLKNLPSRHRQKQRAPLPHQPTHVNSRSLNHLLMPPSRFFTFVNSLYSVNRLSHRINQHRKHQMHLTTRPCLPLTPNFSELPNLLHANPPHGPTKQIAPTSNRSCLNSPPHTKS